MCLLNHPRICTMWMIYGLSRVFGWFCCLGWQFVFKEFLECVQWMWRLGFYNYITKSLVPTYIFIFNFLCFHFFKTMFCGKSNDKRWIRPLFYSLSNKLQKSYLFRQIFNWCYLSADASYTSHYSIELVYLLRETICILILKSGYLHTTQCDKYIALLLL